MTRRVRACILGSVLALTAIAVVFVATAGSNAIQVACGGFEPENPLGGGVRMSPDRAASVFPRPLVRPQNRIASDDTIAELWVRRRSPEVYIVYRSGVILTLRPVDRPTWELARDFTADGSPGELVKVRGVDVFTVPPQRPCFGGNAVFNIGGTHVAVINDGPLPFGAVRSITESIIDTSPAAIADHRGGGGS